MKYRILVNYINQYFVEESYDGISWETPIALMHLVEGNFLVPYFFASIEKAERAIYNEVIPRERMGLRKIVKTIDVKLTL